MSDEVKALSKDQEKQLEDTLKKTRKHTKHERDMLCFKMFLDGKSTHDISKASGISIQGVRKKIRTHKWRDKRKKVFDEAWGEAVKVSKGIGSNIMMILRKQVKRLEEASNHRDLTTDEIRELRSLMALFMNEIRLEDGKPTAISDGVQRHEIILPPTVKRFGVDPPSKTVQLVTHEEAKVQNDKHNFTLDDVEE